MFTTEALPPLPVTLEEAHKEIRYLQRELYKARQAFAEQVVERQKDGRALRGNIKALAEENRKLRDNNGK